MEKLIIISCNQDKPVQDFIKDSYEVLIGKTEAGVEHIHLILKNEINNTTKRDN